MTVIKISYIIVLSCITLIANAQVILHINDKETGKPVSEAAVTIQEIDSRKMNLIVSDLEGIVTINQSPPYRVIINHINYESWTNILRQNGSKSISLNPVLNELDEVVVTGQYVPQSAKNSVYKVKSIGVERIQAQGATTLQDVLSNELNIRFSRDNATGSSRLSLQGLSGQNVKVLLDGVPLIGRSGLENEIDLNQINVNNIDRIEIVEGPMAVNYGADALAGVINIITKKDVAGRLRVDVALQEETVGKEFSFFKDGIHNPSVNLGYNINDALYMQAESRINRFGGWTGDGEGRNKKWYPKTQLLNGGLIRYERDDFSIHYRLDHLNETIQDLGVVNKLNPLKDPFAIDEEFISTRWMHQLQSDLKIKEVNMNSVVSYTAYDRITHQFSKNMVTGEEQNTIDSEQDTAYFNSFFFRNTLANFLPLNLPKMKGTFQAGVDGDIANAGGSKLSAGEKNLINVGVFSSAEFVFRDLKIRPGIRFSYNSVFTTIPTPSLNFMYDLNDRTQMRFGYGRGYRAPSIRELYHEFIDASHNIQGNNDLKPEYSHNVNADISYKLVNHPLTFNFGAFYNDIENRIDFIIPEDVNQLTRYANFLKFKTTGFQLNTDYSNQSLTLKTGFSYIGRYQLLTKDSENIPEFLFSPEARINVQYRLKSNIEFATFYKFTGENKNYQLVTNDVGEEAPELTKMRGYHLMDITATKNWSNKLSLGIGIKNAFNTTSVRSRVSSGSVHGGGTTGQSAISYGRSYFIRLNYHFTKP